MGLGVSTVPHPYLHADSEADAVVDLLRAARDVVAAAGVDWPDALLLTGFSQGGHATLAAQRLLEAAPLEGLTVKAAAPIAGPFDLAGISFPFALEGHSKSSSLYLAYLVGAYANIYGEALATALRDPYASNVPVLFDGLHDGDAIMAALPANPREMFHEEFLQTYARRRAELAARAADRKRTLRMVAARADPVVFRRARRRCVAARGATSKQNA